MQGAGAASQGILRPAAGPGLIMSLCARGPGGIPSTGRQPDTPLFDLFTITPTLWPNDS